MKRAYHHSRQLLVTTVLLLSHLTSVQPKSVDGLETGPQTGSETGSLREMRKLLLTKDNIEEHLARKQKELLVKNIPEPLDVSTSLDFSAASDEPDLVRRRGGRAYPDGQGHVVVEGVRESDDGSDRISHRNGRYINNVFVPDNAQVPPETRVSSHRRGRRMSEHRLKARALNPDFDEYYLAENKGIEDSIAMESLDVDQPRRDKPVYYILEEPDSLHGDRSPFSFEPADMHLEDPDNVYPEQYVIKEHTYEMCPGCPTFNIPVPTPHEHQQQQQQQHQRQKQHQQQQQQQQEESKNFLEKAGQQIFSSFKRFLNKPGKNGDDATKISEKRGEADTGSSKQNFIPIMVAGAAAVALGGLALFGTPPSVATVNSAKDELIYQRRRSNEEVMRSLDFAKEVYED